MTRFWNNLHQVHSKSKDWKAKLNFGSNKTKMPKQDTQNRLRSPMPEGGKYTFLTVLYKHKVIMTNIGRRNY